MVGAGGENVLALDGTFGELAARCGIELGLPDGVYAVADPAAADDVVAVAPAAAALISRSFALGDAALRQLAPDDEPVLWPEHFDLGVSLDEVNYGVSPGDSSHAEPYAYVGPWVQRVGAFWDRPFGASRLMRSFADSAALLAFFERGRERAAADPRAEAT